MLYIILLIFFTIIMILDYRAEQNNTHMTNDIRGFIDYVVIKYDVKSYDDFYCPHVKRLAERIKYFK